MKEGFKDRAAFILSTSSKRSKSRISKNAIQESRITLLRTLL
jgi:hypothetical protein